MLKSQMVDMAKEVLPHLKAMQEIIQHHAEAEDFTMEEIANVAISGDGYCTFRMPSWDTNELIKLRSDEAFRMTDYGLSDDAGDFWEEGTE